MEKGLNSFFKKKKKRICVLMKACITSKKFEVKIIEAPANSNGDF